MQIAYPFMWFLPPIFWAAQRFRPGCGAAVLLPSTILRFLTFKLQWDLQQIPAMHELARVALRVLFNGDVSQWDRAIQMPHYNTQSMPAISLHTAIHLIQVPWPRQPPTCTASLCDGMHGPTLLVSPNELQRLLHIHLEVASTGFAWLQGPISTRARLSGMGAASMQLLCEGSQ